MCICYITTQSPFHRLAAIRLQTWSTMLSVEGSSGSASTNQTATYEQHRRGSACGSCPWCGNKGWFGGAWDSQPQGKRWSWIFQRPRSALVSDAITEISSSSDHGGTSPRRDARRRSYTRPSQVPRLLSVSEKGVVLEWSGGRELLQT